MSVAASARRLDAKHIAGLDMKFGLRGDWNALTLAKQKIASRRPF